MSAAASSPAKPRKVLLLGSGALKIGEAGEFDYSGSQAIKALKEEGISVVLVNPNIATIQTSEHLADRVYFLPVTPAFVEKIIAREKPDGILLSFGGQTALNCGLALWKSGALGRHKVRVLGTPVEAVEKTEDRALFNRALAEIGLKSPQGIAVRSVESGLRAAERIGYPVMARVAYALGGRGSGLSATPAQLREALRKAFAHSKQVLIEEYLQGWKEIEYEVVRDDADNCVTVCNMENFDPMGIHTGESIVIAPSQTLTNTEYHRLREIAIRAVRHLGIVGECNIQYALHPRTGDYRIIEVNARLSRSSALASKATGYPLAFVATKLALGRLLPQLPNSITRVTSACFEPALDYLVVKIPRWDLKKFARVSKKIGSEMKSVGEVMAIGRSFEEAIQKAARMLQIGMYGVVCNPNYAFDNLEKELRNPTDERLFGIAEALRKGETVERIHALTRIDPWFLHKIRNIVEGEASLRGRRLASISMEELREAKRRGFSDKQIGLLTRTSEAKVRSDRIARGIVPVVKQIDTLAAEYPAQTNYLYLTYHGTEDDVEFERRAESPGPPAAESSTGAGSGEAASGATGSGGLQGSAEADLGETAEAPENLAGPAPKRGSSGSSPSPVVQSGLPKAGERSRRAPAGAARTTFRLSRPKPSSRPQTIMVLGSGSYSIGSSVEFDWCCVNAALALKAQGRRTIMVNYNPETVSTDYDICDRLYFDELSLERVLDIYEKEDPDGIVLSMGGQVPNNLALKCHKAGLRVLGTSPVDIDRAEDRNKFSRLLDRLGVDQPEWAELRSIDEARSFARRIGYPVLIRPSYVLSGAAMSIVFNERFLRDYLKKASLVSPEHPVVISKFILNAKEIELDAVADRGRIILSAIVEHVENAGVHSGDATMVLPPQRLYIETIRRIREIGTQIAAALRITGPFNIQFLAKTNEIKVIECNLRASRSFPFVSKVARVNFVESAVCAMVGRPRANGRSTLDLNYVGVKAPQFSFSRLQGADPALGVEMASTGEVACLGDDVHEAFLKAMLSAGFTLPRKNILLTIGGEASKHRFLKSALTLRDLGFNLFATEHTAAFLKANGVPAMRLYKVHEKQEPNIRDYVARRVIDFVISVPNPDRRVEFDSDYRLRRMAVDFSIPLLTNIQVADLLVQSLATKGTNGLKIKAWDEYI